MDFSIGLFGHRTWVQLRDEFMGGRGLRGLQSRPTKFQKNVLRRIQI